MASDWCRNCSLSKKAHPYEKCPGFEKPLQENLVPITCIVQGCSSWFYAADATAHYRLKHQQSGTYTVRREREQATQGELFA